MSSATITLGKTEVREKCINKLKELIIIECKTSDLLKSEIAFVESIQNSLIEQIMRGYIDKYSISEENIGQLFESLAATILKDKYNHTVSAETKTKGLKLCKILIKAM
jgi:hypothetical protein